MWIQSLFLALLVVIFLQSRYFPRRNFKSLKYKRSFEPNVVTEGDKVTLVENISNSRLLPIPWARVEAQMSPFLVFGKNPVPKVVAGSANNSSTVRQFQRSMFMLPAYSTTTRRHSVLAARRGYYTVPSVSISTGDILGISQQRSKEYETNTTLTVYPQLISIEDLFQIRSSFSGDIVVRRWIMEDPFFIRGVREYQPTDPQNHINWKMTAKTGRMQVHNYDYTSDLRLMIILNVDTHENQWSVTTDEPCAERAISIAASVAQYSLENGIETGFVSNGKYVDDPEMPMHLEPVTGDAQFENILQTLAKVDLWRRVTFQTLLEEEASSGLSGRDYLIISAYTNKEIDEALEHLRDAGNNVEVLTVPHTEVNA